MFICGFFGTKIDYSRLKSRKIIWPKKKFSSATVIGSKGKGGNLSIRPAATLQNAFECAARKVIYGRRRPIPKISIQ